jgi:methionyl-tRNA synthetase
MAKKATKAGNKSKAGSKGNTEKVIVTAALPYANGNIHIGHLLEYIQADIYSRFLKLQGKDALYICASDMHGTPIELNAKKAGKDPEKFALEFWKEHQADFKSFLIKFDNYHKTHSKENKELAEYFFSELKKKKLIYQKKMQTIYCGTCNRYLPDRFVKGTCPNCTTQDQYGDVCESCNSVLKGIDLINPKCVVCSRTPIQKESEHYFFKLSSMANELKKWINAPESNIQQEVKNWLKGWLDKGLEDWCISRDEPYFGFEIPNSKKETGATKYFYVWLDAPIGYISSTKNYCSKKKGDIGKGKTKTCNWEDYWRKGKVYHIIGKDIAYFHYLFWPAMLMAVGIPTPKLTTHGFITVNGEKMSKSRGTFFTAKDFLKLYPAEALRFFYASHLNRNIVDVDLSFDDFIALNNNVLVGSLGNFCYRVLTFAEKNYPGVDTIGKEEELTGKVIQLVEGIKSAYEKQDFQSAVKKILQVADLGNAYFQQSEPWKNKESAETKKAVGWCVNLARNLAVLVAPILPEFSEKVLQTFHQNISGGLSLSDIGFKWKGELKKVEMLVQKIEKVPESATFPLMMRVGEIKEVKEHPNADSLYLFQVDFGLEFGERQVVAGLKKYFKKDQLLGAKSVFCINMKPAKIRGEKSQAMIMVADDGAAVSLLEVGNSNIGEEVQFEDYDNSASEVTFDEFLELILTVKDGHVVYEGKEMNTETDDVLVSGVKQGARIR